MTDERRPPEWILNLGAWHVGSDHWLAWESNGNLLWAHPCVGPGANEETGIGVGSVDVTSGTRHKVSNRDPLTIEGSLLCLGCKAHGFIRDGKWVPA